jgi:ABC-type branched-subunit amino acid transport system substrate-binding protein
VQTWQKEINDSGGINGRQIVLKTVDNQFTADGAIAACKEIESNGTFMAVTIAGFTAQDDCLDAAGIPVLDIGPAYLKSSWKNVLAFHFGPAYVPAYVSFLKSSYMNAAAKTVGIVYNGDIPQIASEFEPLKAELKREGFRLVNAEKVTSNQASFVPEMSRMQAAGAQLVMLDVATEAPGVVRDAKAIGYAPQWYLGTFGGSLDVNSQAANELFRGIRGVNFSQTVDSSGFAAFLAKVRKYQGDAIAQSADGGDAGIYALSDIAGGLLQLAGRNFTRRSFMTSALTISQYDRVHIYPPFTLRGKSVPVGNQALFPVECCNSGYTFKVIGPAKEHF